MASVGVNYRSSSGYVTDNAGEINCLGDTYPVTKGGFAQGWTTIQGDNARDRQAGNDRRIAGINFQTNNASQATYRLDFGSSGTKNVRVGLGDGGSSQAYQYLRILDSDNTTALLTITDTNGTAANNFDDATPGAGTSYSAANWPASNSPQSITLTGTSVYLRLGAPTAQSESSTLAHFYIEDVGGGSTAVPVFMHHYRQQVAA